MPHILIIEDDQTIAEEIAAELISHGHQVDCVCDEALDRATRDYFDPGANLINVDIARQRKKLGMPGRPSPISTIKGEGYRLDAV